MLDWDGTIVRANRRKILALDLGTNCGYAVLQGQKLLDSGRWKLLPLPAKRVHRGERWLNFSRALAQIAARHSVDVLAFEMVRRHIGTTAAHVYGGFLAGIEAYQLGRILRGSELLPELPLEVSTWKKLAVGNGRASKPEVRAAMDKRFKIKTKSEDEADALGIAVAARMTLP